MVRGETAFYERRLRAAGVDDRVTVSCVVEQVSHHHLLKLWVGGLKSPKLLKITILCLHDGIFGHSKHIIFCSDPSIFRKSPKL